MTVLVPWGLYLLTGAVAGVLAGLLGVGGGIVIVPALGLLLAFQGLATGCEMQVALGTSLGTIVFTSLASLRAHHRRGAVRWAVVRTITPGILAGTFTGTFLAARLPTSTLKVIFAVFLALVATQMLLDLRPKGRRDLPSAAATSGVGAVVGGISSLVGIGGGTLSVPFLSWCGVAMHEAVGTSAAIGFPIALAGALGYAVNGWGVAGRPEPSLGYLYLPAVIGIVLASILTVPLGARLAHALPVRRLRQVFAFFLLATALRMAWGVVHGVSPSSPAPETSREVRIGDPCRRRV